MNTFIGDMLSGSSQISAAAPLFDSPELLHSPETNVTETSQAAASMIGNDDGVLIPSG